eukprot:scaffold26885_cov112-Isochrysis_galbana.AAC.4
MQATTQASVHRTPSRLGRTGLGWIGSASTAQCGCFGPPCMSWSCSSRSLSSPSTTCEGLAANRPASVVWLAAACRITASRASRAADGPSTLEAVRPSCPTGIREAAAASASSADCCQFCRAAGSARLRLVPSWLPFSKPFTGLVPGGGEQCSCAKIKARELSRQHPYFTIPLYPTSEAYGYGGQLYCVGLV